MSIAKRSSLIVVAFISLFAFVNSAHAYRYPSVSDVLSSNGFGTLKFALDTTNLTSVLEDNRVTIFAPTDDVFEATAQALGCADAVDLAVRLIATPVGETDALTAILTYHAKLGVIRSSNSLLRKGEIGTVQGGTLTSGVNANGLFVQGSANASPSSITSNAIGGFRYSIFPIDQILLPFAPPATLCDS